MFSLSFRLLFLLFFLCRVFGWLSDSIGSFWFNEIICLQNFDCPVTSKIPCIFFIIPQIKNISQIADFTESSSWVSLGKCVCVLLLLLLLLFLRWNTKWWTVWKKPKKLQWNSTTLSSRAGIISLVLFIKIK